MAELSNTNRKEDLVSVFGSELVGS